MYVYVFVIHHRIVGHSIFIGTVYDGGDGGMWGGQAWCQTAIGGLNPNIRQLQIWLHKGLPPQCKWGVAAEGCAFWGQGTRFGRLFFALQQVVGCRNNLLER